MADPIPYDTDATGPIPKPVAVPSVDVEMLIRRLTTHVGQPVTGRVRETAEEIAKMIPDMIEEDVETVVEIITTHLSASPDNLPSLSAGDEAWKHLPEEELEARASADHERRRYEGEQMRGWQPISTAPKDSSWILGLMPNRRQTVVRWGGGAWEDDNRLCRDPKYWQPLPPAITVLEEMERGGKNS